MTMKNNANYEDELTCCQNWHEEYKFWPDHSKISKICTSMGCFWSKYIIFALQKNRGVIFHDTEEWCKI